MARQQEKRKRLPKSYRNLYEALAARFHGAANIKGVHYQLLYSVLRAFDLYAVGSPGAHIRLEGIEDVDLIGFRDGAQFVQAKCYSEPLSWHLLDGPLKGFVEVYRADPSCTFLLVSGGPIAAGVKDLNDSRTLKGKKRKNVRAKLKERFKKIGVSQDEGFAVVERLEVVQVPGEEIVSKLEKVVAERFDLSGEAVDIHIRIFVDQFLRWAKERRTVKRDDLDRVRAVVGEALAAEKEFQAFGKRLIDRLTWEPDKSRNDFFEGKATRSGHIAAQLDVARPNWLARIDSVLRSTAVCVILSSSGQGKSTLLYRYAHEQQFMQNPFILRVVESEEHVGLIRNYLVFWSKLIPSALVLIDNAGWRTRLWPLIAQECAALGIKVLVSTRHEDWYRFRRESLTSYELVEPLLSLDEAKQLFSAFKRNKRIHKNVPSAGWAYERIGEPHLLIEYVYLLTHGRMLEERLRDQIRQFEEQGEDPGKLEILRRVSLAHSLGAHVLTDKLLENVTLARDPKETIESLQSEYLTVDNKFLRGLHWVRSDHLTAILHDPYPQAAETALATLNAIPEGQTKAFVANALCNKLIQQETFLCGLKDRGRASPLSEILTLLSGIFEAGERQFIQENLDRFNEVRELFGWRGPKRLSFYLLPADEDQPRRKCKSTSGISGEDAGILEAKAAACRDAERGVNLCGVFLQEVVGHLELQELSARIGETGRLLDWCRFCGVQIPNWPEFREALVGETTIFDHSFEEFCDFAQGIGRYDGQLFNQFFDAHREKVLGYLRYHTDCVSLSVTDNELAIEFFVDDDEDYRDQAMRRLGKLRRALPTCARYRSRGLWTLPYGLPVPVDDTKMDLRAAALPFETDTDKNKGFDRLLELCYSADSFYRYQESWYKLRTHSLKFVNWLSTVLGKKLAGIAPTPTLLKDGTAAYESLNADLKFRVDAPSQTPQDLQTLLAATADKWAFHFERFSRQISEHAAKHQDRKVGNLTIHNFRDAVRSLKETHRVFDELFKIVPDYFDMKTLDDQEMKEYALLDDHLYAWIIHPPATKITDATAYSKSRKSEELQARLRRFRDAFAPLRESGFAVIIPDRVYEEHPLTHLPIAISVENPIHPEKALTTAIEVLGGHMEVADFVYVVPLYQGFRVIDGAYRFDPRRISEILSGGLNIWHYLVALELPDDVRRLLPRLPRQELPELTILGNTNALVGQLDAVSTRYHRISPLEGSQDEFDQKQYARLLASLKEFVGKLRGLALETRELMNQGFADVEQNDLLMPAREFLNAVSRAEEAVELIALQQPGRVDQQAIVNGLASAVEMKFIKKDGQGG